MNEDWKFLKSELDRVEGRVLDFGSFAGMRVEHVGRIDRPYLFWCLEAVPLRPELRRTILRVLAHAAPGTRHWQSARRRAAVA